MAHHVLVVVGRERGERRHREHALLPGLLDEQRVHKELNPPTGLRTLDSVAQNEERRQEGESRQGARVHSYTSCENRYIDTGSNTTARWQTPDLYEAYQLDLALRLL